MFYFALPFFADYRTRRWPVVTFILMGLSVLVYLFAQALWFHGGEAAVGPIKALCLVPAYSAWYTQVTSIFVYGGLSQLAGSMIYLFLFGACVEDLIGRTKFVLLYLLGGVLGHFVQIATTPGHFTSMAPILGDSGAITACMSGFLLLLTRTRIEFKWVSFAYKGFAFSSGSFFVPAWIIIAIWFVADVVMMVLTQLGKVQDGGMAFAGHVAGFVWGLAAISVAKRRMKNPDTTEAGSPELVPNEGTSSTPVEAPSIYLLLSQVQSGPFTREQVAGMLNDGSLPADALYWESGMAEWRTVAEFHRSPAS